MYGVYETNPIEYVDGQHPAYLLQGTVELSDPSLVRITRLRLLGERGYPSYDISYCYGVLADGTPVRVQVDTMSISRRTPKADLIAMAKRAGRYAKGLGLLDETVWSILI